MPKPTLHVQWLAASALCAWVASVTLACDSSSADPAADEQSTGGAPSGGSASAGGPAEIEPPPTGGAQVLLDASVDDADPHCSSTVTCTPDGGRYCGEIGDGCGDNIDCGSCPGDWICEDHLCVGGPSCAPIVCDTGTTRFCGTVGDGCGHALECGACAAGETCTGGVCAPVACVPLTCTTVSGRFCGSIGDGCGHSLECGECPDGGVCGGGVDHLCWDPTCTQAECTTANGGQFCGVIGDGCGGIRDCGPCANDWACEENVCVGGPTCEAFTCQSGDTRFCGTFGDGCGRGLACGDCGDGQHCEAGICIDNACIPLTCDSTAARYCGQIGDGCGRVLDCGECPDGGACGGGTFPNVCIDPNCEPKGCVTDNGGVYCGTIGDGCGGILDCNDPCPNDGVCGADDRPNICPGTGTGCINLQCQVRTDCPDGATTTLSGIVYDPAGVNPIFNALVYVPNAPVDPITTGATCEPCGAMASGQALTSALTDATGHFTLENVPGGADIPLVVQVGKWRRQVRIPTVTDCIDNPLSDPELTRLPSTQSEGDMPQIAVTTGVRDSLECLLRTIGIADSEFTTDGGSGRVHLYYGGDLSGPDGLGAGPSAFAPTLNGGAAFSSAETLWADAAKMLSYDIQLYDCEGGGAASPKAPYLPNFLTYVNGGGRAFLDHYHYSWLQQAELAGTANYLNRSGDLPQGGITAYIDTSFPKAAALADWMVNVGVTPRGEFEILEGQHSVTGVIAPTQEWIYVPANPLDEEERRSTQYMTFNTPLTVPEESQCGRVVFTDLHVAAGEGEATRDVTAPFPTNCSIAPLTAQGKALEFLFFDLSACIEPPEVITVPPPPPDVPPTEPPPATTAPPAPPAVPPPPTDAPPLSETPPAAPPPPPPPPPPELR